MKKALYLLLAALLVLSLAACGKQPATPTPDPTPDPAPNEAPKLVEALIPAEEYPDIVWENAGGGPCWNENYIVTVGNDDSGNSKTIFYSTNRQTGETRSTELDGLWVSDSLALYGDSFYWLTIEANKETGERELLLLKYDCATLEKTTVFTEPCEYWADNSQLAIDDEWAIYVLTLSDSEYEIRGYSFADGKNHTLMKLESSIFPRLVQMTDGCYSVALQEPDGWATRIIRLADDETVWENRSESTRVPTRLAFNESWIVLREESQADPNAGSLRVWNRTTGEELNVDGLKGMLYPSSELYLIGDWLYSTRLVTNEDGSQRQALIRIHLPGDQAELIYDGDVFRFRVDPMTGEIAVWQIYDEPSQNHSTTRKLILLKAS